MKQVFQRVPCPAPAAQGDARFAYFTQRVLPELQRELVGGVGARLDHRRGRRRDGAGGVAGLAAGLRRRRGLGPAALGRDHRDVGLAAAFDDRLDLGRVRSLLLDLGFELGRLLLDLGSDLGGLPLDRGAGLGGLLLDDRGLFLEDWTLRRRLRLVVAGGEREDRHDGRQFREAHCITSRS